jgi:hypothetical protein
MNFLNKFKKKTKSNKKAQIGEYEHYYFQWVIALSVFFILAITAVFIAAQTFLFINSNDVSEEDIVKASRGEIVNQEALTQTVKFYEKKNNNFETYKNNPPIAPRI